MHLIGFYAYFIVRQNQIRQEMRESIGLIPTEEFETFILSEEEYQQIRVNDHEVKIDGRMYDHGVPKLENGKITLHAKHDKDEDNLISLLSEVVNSASKDKKPIPSQLFNFFGLTFISPSPLVINNPSTAIELHDGFVLDLLSQDFPVESPPPRLV